MQGEEGDFGGAAEADGQVDGADAAIDVELHAVELKGAVDVFAAHVGQEHGREKRQADLAAVGVAGEHEVDVAEVADGVGEVGLVAEEDDGCARGLGRDGLGEVGNVEVGVGEAADPEAVAAEVDAFTAVVEDGECVFLKRGDDAGLVDAVVVAEGAEAERAGEATEDFCADFGVLAVAGPVAGVGGDEVAGEGDHVGLEGVDLCDNAAEEEIFVEVAVVEVGDLGDAKAVKGGRQIGEASGVFEDGDVVAVDFRGVEQEGTGGDGGDAKEEFAAGWVTRLPRNPAHRVL